VRFKINVAQPFRAARRPLAGLKACATRGRRRFCNALLGHQPNGRTQDADEHRDVLGAFQLAL
jgi:hypothetical protein